MFSEILKLNYCSALWTATVPHPARYDHAERPESGEGRTLLTSCISRTKVIPFGFLAITLQNALLLPTTHL